MPRFKTLFEDFDYDGTSLDLILDVRYVQDGYGCATNVEAEVDDAKFYPDDEAVRIPRPVPRSELEDVRRAFAEAAEADPRIRARVTSLCHEDCQLQVFFRDHRRERGRQAAAAEGG